MSVRSLFEINHDLAWRIEEHSAMFVEDLIRFISSGSTDAAETLSGYGLIFRGTRHHSESYNVSWGSFQTSNHDRGEK